MSRRAVPPPSPEQERLWADFDDLNPGVFVRQNGSVKQLLLDVQNEAEARAVLTALRAARRKGART